MTSYAIIIEGSDGAFSAYAPDLPGCVAAGESVEDVASLMRDAIALHIEGLRAHGEAVPAPSAAAVRMVDVA